MEPLPTRTQPTVQTTRISSETRLSREKGRLSRRFSRRTLEEMPTPVTTRVTTPTLLRFVLFLLSRRVSPSTRPLRRVLPSSFFPFTLEAELCFFHQFLSTYPTGRIRLRYSSLSSPGSHATLHSHRLRSPRPSPSSLSQQHQPQLLLFRSSLLPRSSSPRSPIHLPETKPPSSLSIWISLSWNSSSFLVVEQEEEHS